MRQTTLVLAAILAGCAAENTPPDRTEIAIPGSADFTPQQQQAIGEVVNAFRDECPDLFAKYWGDVSAANIDIQESCCWGEEAFGWAKEAYLTVKIGSDPKTIPASFRANGHTLHYWLGNGRQPGIASMKEQSQLVCGWTPHDDARDTFISVPAMSALSVF